MQINVSKIIKSKDIMELLPNFLKKQIVSVLDEGLRNCRLVMSETFHINENINTQLNNFLSKYATNLGLKEDQVKYVYYPGRVINNVKYNILTIYCILT